MTDLESRNAYTATLDSGNSFELRRTATYGEILIGVSGILLSFLMVFSFIVEMVNERNARLDLDSDPGNDRRFQRPIYRPLDRPGRR